MKDSFVDLLAAYKDLGVAYMELGTAMFELWNDIVFRISEAWEILTE